MSTTYPSYNYSSFPDSIDQFDRFTDLTLHTIEYAKQYNTYMTQGDISSAAKLLVDHPELRTSLINAANLNRIIDAIKCIETFYAEDVQKYLINIIKYRSEFSSSTKYSKYDVVMYNKLGYLCISSETPIGTIPTNKDFFVPLTLQGEQGIAGLNLTFEGTWDSTITYSSDSCVTHNNVLYASLVDDNLAKTPSKSSSYWTVVIDFDKLTTYDNSTSGLNSVSLQNAVDEVNTKINTNTSSINTINSKLNGIESGAQKNTITGIKGSAESSYRTGNVNITPANLGITVVNNTSDSNKSVKYAASAGSANSATTAGTCTGNSATATSANYANSAGNSDTVDGFHFKLSTTDLVAGTSSLATNTFYFVYE